MKRWLIWAYSIVAAGALTACSTPAQQTPGAAADSTVPSATATITTSTTDSAATTVEHPEATSLASDTPASKTFEKGAVIIPPSPTPSPSSTSTTQRNQPPKKTLTTSTTKRTAPRTTQAPRPTTKPAPTRSTATTKPRTTTKPATPASYVEQVAALTNAERQKAGVSALTLDATLSQNAAVRAKEIVTKFDHTRPNGSKFHSAITIPWRTVGENIAYGQRSPQEVVTGWMNSAGHRENILKSSFTKIGVGVYESGGRLYWVQLFAG